ncbi:DUF1206 domain-containing protein [Teichococcus aestuarii]|uniref:DUF1206 domain-containing protein n=1 Tax=Teichococcus aestuarii TaxID=568898 RepID=UPI003605FC06
MPSHRHALEMFARLGYAARGAVSLIIGSLALLAAVGPGGQATGSKGALRELLLHPFGGVLLGVVGLGLFGFALWRALQGLLDADNHGHGAKALAIRGGALISAVAYTGLGISAFGLLLGRGGGGGGDDQSAQDWTRWLLAKPAGEVLVAAIGLIVMGVGVAMLARGWRASFTRHLRCPAEASRWVVPLGRLGFAARGVVFLIIGLFLVVAAWQSDPQEVRGLGSALLALQAQPFGRVLFGVVALGLAAFGAFEFAEARYRRIDAPG